jgi:hypothetical protein
MGAKAKRSSKYFNNGKAIKKEEPEEIKRDSIYWLVILWNNIKFFFMHPLMYLINIRCSCGYHYWKPYYPQIFDEGRICKNPYCKAKEHYHPESDLMVPLNEHLLDKKMKKELKKMKAWCDANPDYY